MLPIHFWQSANVLRLSQTWQIMSLCKLLLGNVELSDWPVSSSHYAHGDDHVSLDHRNISHPVHDFKWMMKLCDRHPVLNDGWNFDVATENGLYNAPRERKQFFSRR